MNQTYCSELISHQPAALYYCINVSMYHLEVGLTERCMSSKEKRMLTGRKEAAA